jgi:putative oxidoreductase
LVLPPGEKSLNRLKLFRRDALSLDMNNTLSRLKLLYDRFFDLFNYLRTPFLLLVRLYWGWQLIQSGWGKLHHLANVTEFFTSLGLPMPAQTAVAISCLEFFGGIFLAVGLLSRLTAFALTINMIVAYITADREALFSIFSDPDKFYAAAPYTFLIASVIILLFGPGKIALDTLLERWLGGPPATDSR